MNNIEYSPTTMGVTNIFMGVPQSKYAGLAIMTALISACVAILLGKESMPLSQKISSVVLLLIVSVPGILYSLFQITCLVSGAGVRNQRWWCSTYAWLITVLIIVYAVLLIAVALLSIFTRKSIHNDLESFYNGSFDATMDYANKFVSPGMSPAMDSYSQSSEPDMYTNMTNMINGAISTLTGSTMGNSMSNPLRNGNSPAETFGENQGDHIIAGTERANPYPYTNGTMIPQTMPNSHGWMPIGGPDLPPGA